MMRLDGQPENQFNQTVASLLREIDALKNRQEVGGHSLLVRYNKTANTWDVDETVSGSQLLAQWRVTFTPSELDHPYAQLSYDYQVTPDSGFNLGQLDAYPDPANISSTSLVYLVDYTNPNLSDVNMKIKFGFKCADSGTIAWTRLPGV